MVLQHWLCASESHDACDSLLTLLLYLCAYATCCWSLSSGLSYVCPSFDKCGLNPVPKFRHGVFRVPSIVCGNDCSMSLRLLWLSISKSLKDYLPTVSHQLMWMVVCSSLVRYYNVEPTLLILGDYCVVSINDWNSSDHKNLFVVSRQSSSRISV